MPYISVCFGVPQKWDNIIIKINVAAHKILVYFSQTCVYCTLFDVINRNGTYFFDVSTVYL